MFNDLTIGEATTKALKEAAQLKQPNQSKELSEEDQKKIAKLIIQAKRIEQAMKLGQMLEKLPGSITEQIEELEKVKAKTNNPTEKREISLLQRQLKAQLMTIQTHDPGELTDKFVKIAVAANTLEDIAEAVEPAKNLVEGIINFFNVLATGGKKDKSIPIPKDVQEIIDNPPPK